MKRPATSLFAIFVALAATLASPSLASAALRVPQVDVIGGGLQAYLNGVGEAINVNTDQDATQTWSHTVERCASGGSCSNTVRGPPGASRSTTRRSMRKITLSSGSG